MEFFLGEGKNIQMKNWKEKVSMEQFKNMIEVLNTSIDAYLYIYDLQNDYYCISPNALERFRIPASEFGNASEVISGFTYYADVQVLKEDLELIRQNQTTSHDLQYRWLDNNNNAIWINCRGIVLHDDDDKPKYLIGAINEIGNKQKADNISGLLGEVGLQSDFLRYYDEETGGFVLRLGIDNFKEINDNKGTEYGDMILRKTADCIAAVISPGQTSYRIVADEFIVLDCTGRTIADAIALYNQIHEKINQFIAENGYEVFYTLSAGILDLALVKQRSYSNIMTCVGFALNEAKEHGRNRYFLFAEEDYQKFLYEHKLLKSMRHAINSKFEGFETYFQPIMNLQKGGLSGAETLLRFTLDTGECISPSKIVPLLEMSGLIIPIGKWILENAVKACSEIRKVLPDFRVSVNISYVQVLKSDILSDILETLNRYGLDSGGIMIELTESGFLEADENFMAFCDGLKKHHIPLALDDFGTGYSNFRYLAELYPNFVKIDRSFTLKALNSTYEYQLLRHMADMIHSIDLRICIEGVETEDEFTKISGISPDCIQGYYFGRPCNLETFRKRYLK